MHPIQPASEILEGAARSMSGPEQLSIFNVPDTTWTEPAQPSSPGSLRYSFNREKQLIIRAAQCYDGHVVETIPAHGPVLISEDCAAAEAFDATWLRSEARPPWPDTTRPMAVARLADLFSGCGGLSLGIEEACRSLGVGFSAAYALDSDPDALDVYQHNFTPTLADGGDAEQILDGSFGATPTARERMLLDRIGRIDFVVGGPPCQGHSDLNNHTRRDDPRNRLILKVVRFAELTRPAFVVIENVQGTAHDRTGAVQLAVDQLHALGYVVSSGLLSALDVGVAQGRRRFFIVASRFTSFSFPDTIRRHRAAPRSFDWACGELMVDERRVFESAARHSMENQRRISVLHDQGLHELPNAERPDCHRLKKHAYNSVYGRMWADRPAPTITTGFGSTGQGRFVHPRQRRTITPHEAARLQFFPDFFDFGDRGRRAYQKLIGNAVPPKLGFVIGYELLKDFRK